MSEEPTGPDPLDGIEVPDDLSGLLGAEETEVEFAALITQLASAQALAAACSLAQVAADALPVETGALAVLTERGAGAPAGAATRLSGLVKGVPLILVTRHRGQLTMTRYRDGEAGDTLAPGLVLSGAPADLEGLLIGTTRVEGAEGAVASSSISRWRAMRLLASAARKGRRS